MLIPLTVLVLALSGPRTAEYRADGIHLRIAIESQIYTFEITNEDAPPITSFETISVHTYNHQVPDGWAYSHEAGVFRIWADGDANAIRRGRSRTFSARVGSTGASLGLVPATFGFANESDPVVMERVWGATYHPRSILVATVLTIAGLGLLHAGLLAWRERG